MILRCPTCAAIVQPTDEVCPICQHPVPESVRTAEPAAIVATSTPRTRPRSGRIAVRVVAVLGWVLAIVVLVAMVRAWV